MLGTAGTESWDLLHRQICIASIPACSLGSTEAETVEHPTCNCLWIVCAWGLTTTITASSVFTAPTTCLSSGLSCLSFPVSRSPSVLLLAPAPISAAPRPPAIISHYARLQLHPLDRTSGPLHQQQLPSERPNDQVSSSVTCQRAGGGKWAAVCCHHWPTDIYSSAVPVITLRVMPIVMCLSPSILSVYSFVCDRPATVWLGLNVQCQNMKINLSHWIMTFVVKLRWRRQYFMLSDTKTVTIWLSTKSQYKKV